MEDMSLILGIITYIFTIILLIVAIIVGIRIIGLTEKADKVLDDIQEKVNSLNGMFSVVNKVSSSMELISSKIANGIVNLFGKLFKKKKEDNEEDEQKRNR